MADDKQHDNNSLQDSNNAGKADPQTTRPVCGIIRPISAMGDYSEQHWKDVAEILNEPIIEAGFEPNLVSDAAEISIIQKTIIQNLYDLRSLFVILVAKMPMSCLNWACVWLLINRQLLSKMKPQAIVLILLQLNV